jgi:acetoin:2,6-dichlorophenolindophenol oxidoreductase subunit alpha
MLRARRFDEVLCREGDIVNDTYHVSIGLEVSAAGIACARRDGDTITLTHRNHGVLAAIGADLEEMYREIFGRDGSALRGRGGSFHLVDVDRGALYTSALVAGGLPLAVGMAMAHRRLGKDSISLAYLGDGAMEEGVAYESLNAARYWDAPIVFICDNNASGPQSVDSRRRIAALADSCGLLSATLDAEDPARAVSAIEGAAREARASGGPQFVQIICPEWPGATGANRGHPKDTTGPFAIPTVIERDDPWSRVDPLAQEVRQLLEDGIAVDDMLAIDADTTTEVEHAIWAALAAEVAPISVVDDDVWETR